MRTPVSYTRTLHTTKGWLMEHHFLRSPTEAVKLEPEEQWIPEHKSRSEGLH